MLGSNDDASTRLPSVIVDWLGDAGSQQGLIAADQLDAHGNLDELVRAVGRSLASLHATDLSAIADATMPSGWNALAEDIAAGGIADTADLPDPYARYEGRRLRSIWAEGRPDNEDLVVCHGRPTLDRFLIEPRDRPDGGVVVAAVRGSGGMRVIDRHFDLAVIHHSLHHRVGPESVFLFYEAYGGDPDLVRLDHYLLGAMLLDGAIR